MRSIPVRTVLGLDVGGSHTRVVVADDTGRILGRAEGPGANPWSSDVTVVTAITTTARAALDRAGHTVDPAGHALDPASDATRVGAAVAGVAGWVEPAEVRPHLVELLAARGSTADVEVVVDVVVNRAAGSPEPHGLVLTAGTGAIAAEVADDALVRWADGCGWLVGDEGSAVWLGLAAVRAALRALDGRGPATALTDSVVRALLPDGAPPADPAQRRRDLVAAAFARPPATFGALAPDVVVAARRGDPEAVRLTDTAVAHLVTAAVAAAGDGVPTRLVLAGSLLVADGPVRAGVVTALRARWPTTTITLGTDGAAGAAALALRRVTGRPLEAAVHHRLCGPHRLAP
jgi:glucosamine kinase